MLVGLGNCLAPVRRERKKNITFSASALFLFKLKGSMVLYGIPLRDSAKASRLARYPRHQVTVEAADRSCEIGMTGGENTEPKATKRGPNPDLKNTL